LCGYMIIGATPPSVGNAEGVPVPIRQPRPKPSWLPGERICWIPFVSATAILLGHQSLERSCCSLKSFALLRRRANGQEHRGKDGLHLPLGSGVGPHDCRPHRADTLLHEKRCLGRKTTGLLRKRHTAALGHQETCPHPRKYGSSTSNTGP